jgi:hypothetical protein
MLNELFDDAMASQGETYRAVRKKLLEIRASEGFLREVARSRTRSVEERYLADILLMRYRDPDGISQLEDGFLRKSVHGGGSRGRGGGFTFGHIFVDKKYTHWVWTIGKLQDYRHQDISRFPSLEDIEKGAVDPEVFEQVNQYWDRCLLPSSPHWNLLLGEVALKGWVKPRPEFRYGGIGGFEFKGGGPVTDRRGNLITDETILAVAAVPYLPDEILIRNAIEVLGQLKEPRVVELMKKTLLDKSRPTEIRQSCAVALREYGQDSVETLTRVITVQTYRMDSYLISSSALASIAYIGGPAGKEALTRIAQLPKNSLPEGSGDLITRNASDYLQRMQELGQDHLQGDKAFLGY